AIGRAPCLYRMQTAFSIVRRGAPQIGKSLASLICWSARSIVQTPKTQAAHRFPHFPFQTSVYWSGCEYIRVCFHLPETSHCPGAKFQTKTSHASGFPVSTL